MRRPAFSYKALKHQKIEVLVVFISLFFLLLPLVNPPPKAITYPGVVIYPPTQVGGVVIVEGYVGFHCPPGNPDQYHVQVNWEYGGTIVFQNNLTEVPPLKDVGGGNYEYNFSDVRMLNSSGAWIIRVRVYHMRPPGNDGQADAVATITVETVSVTVTTEPAGLSISVDGVTYTAPQTFSWLKNSDHTVSTFSPQFYGDTSYVWMYWSDGGAISHSVTATVNATYTAYFKTRYLVTFGQTGLDDSATGAVVTIDTLAKDYSDLPFSDWYDENASVSYAYADFVGSSESGKRFRLNSVTGPSSPFKVASPTNITGNYMIQYYLTVKTDPEGLVDISGGGWHDKDASVTLTAPDVVLVSTGVRYKFSYWDVDGASQGTGVNPITVTMNAPKTATAHYVLQYYLSVTSLYDTPNPMSGWFNAGTEITATVTSPWPVDAANTRYVCTGWAGTGSVPSSGTGDSVTFTIIEPSSITWNWKTQYYVTFTQTGVGSDFTGTVMTVDGVDYGRDGYAAWYDAGVSVTFNYESPLVVTIDQKQYVLTGVNVSSPLTVSGPMTVTGSYKTQYYLKVVSEYGTTGGEGWYDEGATAYAEVSPTEVYGPAGVKYIFSHWSGDASGTTSPSDPITMNAPKTAVANWKTQYRVTFNHTGLDETAVGTVVTVNGSAKALTDLPFTIWVDSGASVSYVYEPLVSSSTSGKRFRLDSVTGPASPIIVTGSTTVTGNYVIQYEVTFTQTGLDDTAVGIVVIVGSAAKTRADLPFTNWFDSGTTYSYNSTVSSTFAGKRFRLDDVTGPASPVMSPGTVVGNYIPQYMVTFTQSGLDNTATGSVVMVAGESKTYAELPFTTDWLDNGSSLSFTYSNPVASSVSGKRFTLISVSHVSPLTVTEPMIVTGNYKTQYYLTVNTNPVEVLTLNPAAVSGGGWYDSGDTATVDAVQNVDEVAGQSRYDFRSWTGASPTGEGNKATIIMDAPKTATANYQPQYNVTFQQSGIGVDFTGTIVMIDGAGYGFNVLPVSFWWDKDSTHSFSFASPLLVNDGKRYVWISTAGLSSAQSDPAFEVDGSGSIVGNYGVQYHITVVSAHDSPTASSWVDEGSDFTASVTSPTEVVISDHQWVCTGFSVDEEPVQEGTGYTFANVQAPHTIIFYWKQQFWIQVNSDHDAPTPSQWVDQGGSLTVSVTSPADESDGARYRCTGYTLDSNQPVEDGSTSYVFTDVQSAHIITFNWVIQYKVTFYMNPTSGTITADGVTESNGESEFYDEGASVAVIATPPAGYGFSGWTVTGGVTVDEYSSQATSMNVTGTGSLTANFVLRTVSITITSSPVTGAGFVRVDGTSYVTPVTFSWVVGSTHLLEAVSTVPGPTGTRYVWIGWSDGGASSHVYTVPSGSETVTAYFSVQHYLTVVSPYDTPGGSGWYDEGATAYATLETGVVVVGGAQYFFTGWSGDASGTSLRSNPIIMNKPKTAIANWATELYTVTFDKSPRQGVIMVDGAVYTSLPVVLQWVPGSSHEVAVPETEEEPGGIRYVFRIWSDGSTLASRIIVANTPGAVYIAYYDIQYRLTVHSEFGMTTGSGWYNEGAEAAFSVSPTVVRDETRGIEFTFRGWIGNGTGVYYTGSENPAKVIMTGPVEEFAQWEPSMYYLKVVSEYGEPYGSGWYTPNSEAGFGVSTPVNHGNGTIRIFTNWSGDVDLREPVGTIIMVKPSTVVASWDTQYLVVYNTTAPNGVLLSIPRVPQTLPPGFNVFALYYSAGSKVEVGPAPETVYGGEETRYCFEGWAIGGKPVTPNTNLTFIVDRPLNISVIYGTELLLTVNVIGISKPYTVKLTVASSPASIFDVTPASPFRRWLRKGTSVTMTVSSPNKIGHGEWAVFREWSGDTQASQRTVSLTVSTPVTLNAVFFAVNPVAESIPYSLLAGIISTVSSRFIRKRREEEYEDRSHRSLALGIASLVIVLAIAAVVSSHVATGYGIDVRELPDFANWAVVFTAIEAIVFLTMTVVVTRLAYPRRLEIHKIYPNPYGI